MPYTINITKTAPCQVLPFSAPSGAGGGKYRSLEVYGCTPDPTVGENNCNCLQGTYTPVGCCCAFTVPSGVTQVVVEMWGSGGGGGSGASANCCGITPGAGAGTYISGILTVAPGDVLTVCAGAGGCGGPANCDATTYCCTGPRGGCSFIKRNGNFCMDSQGGGTGPSDCYYQCGCLQRSCGHSSFTSSAVYPDIGTNSGCVAYTSGKCIQSGPSMSVVPGCSGNCTNQRMLSSGTPFGADQQWNSYSCFCWSKTRFNTACTNTAGTKGIGGDLPPTGCVFNSAGSTNYACSTADNAACERHQNSMPGMFPGGGGAGGFVTSCCFQHTNGGGGGPGYVRIIY